MFELHGKHNTCKVFTDNCDNETISQITELLNQESVKGSQIRIMPDTHAGKGCVIGTTMTLTDKVIPNLVGVDIGCTDKDTEVLTPDGWIKINEYNDQRILVYDKNSDTTFFDTPYAYIKQKCDKFYHFHSTKGLDQMLSAEHKMLIWRGYKNKKYTQNIEMALDVFNEHNNHTKSNRAIKTTFNFKQENLPISDKMIRVLVMISADGNIRINKNNTTYVELHFRKQRKIDRAKTLLNNAGLSFNESIVQDKSTYIYVTIPTIISKSLQQFYNASKEQLQIVIDEIYHWDGTIDSKRNHKSFSTTDKINADVIQFAHAVNGIRAGIYCINQNENWNTTYNVYETQNEYVGFPNKQLEEKLSIDGYKYCFTTSTGFFIIRRNNCISITGNCGMFALKLEESEIDCEKLDKVIRQYVPSGFSIHDRAIATSNVKDIVAPINVDKAMKSLGTLGGGNHFIEVDRGNDGKLWLVIHTGSRHLGIEVCKHYQDLAYDKIKNNGIQEKIDETVKRLKAENKHHEIENTIKILRMQTGPVPKDLCYVEGDDFKNYIHDMKLAQEHAAINRETIANQIIKHMDWHIESSFQTIHNYIDIDNMILRKGSVSAQKDETLIIPMNMRDGSLICVGKGNPDWNYSAPHGAGRIMSRGQAKQNVSMAEFEESMRGIYTTSVTQSTIDESPMVYKPMQEIIDNIGDTVDIVDIIKPIYNFKASDA